MKLNQSELKRKVFSDWRYFLGFSFGTGLLPKMPGTWATLITIPLVYLLSYFSKPIYLMVCLLVLALGTYLSHILSVELGEHDYGGVNCDEILGFLVVMLPFPCDWLHLVLGFILFRAFDILKPFPISWVDSNIKTGFGMMLDDVLAAGFTIITILFLTNIR